VHVQKIKSKWRAEQRREGLSSTSQREEMDKKEESEPTESGNEETSESRSSGEEEKPVHNGQDPEGSSLRELTKKAYASSSLHNYKSDPLHRRRGESSAQRGGRGGGRGRGRGGQPNMKLRMNAMLEKIKQSVS